MLSRCLMISHAAIAAVTKTHELALEEMEATALADSTVTLLALYDIRPDPKVEAAINLAIVMGTVYGTRIYAIRARKSQEKKEKKPGIAGMYDAEGKPTGTTTYSTEEWPINPEAQNIGSIN
jgi:hypothetical protein